MDLINFTTWIAISTITFSLWRENEQVQIQRAEERTADAIIVHETRNKLKKHAIELQPKRDKVSSFFVMLKDNT